MRRLTEADIVFRYQKIAISPLWEDEKVLIERYANFGDGHCYGNAMQLVFTLTTFGDASARYVLAFGVSRELIFTHGMVKRGGRFIDATLDCDFESDFYAVKEFSLDDILGEGWGERYGMGDAPVLMPPCLHPDGSIGRDEISTREYGQWPRHSV